MADTSVESMVNMNAAIEADMMHQKHGFYGALARIIHTNQRVGIEKGSQV